MAVSEMFLITRLSALRAGWFITASVPMASLLYCPFWKLTQSLYCKNLTSVKDRNVVQVLGLQGHVAGRINARNAFEIMDEMGLVEIAASSGDIGPIAIRETVPELEHLLKAAHTTKQFWRETDFIAEEADEMARAHANLVTDFGNGAHTIVV